MPGKRMTGHQVHKFKEHRKALNQVAAAAKVGFSEQRARRFEQSTSLPSQGPTIPRSRRAGPHAAPLESGEKHSAGVGARRAS